jgi:hypothetical protein
MAVKKERNSNLNWVTPETSFRRWSDETGIANNCHHGQELCTPRTKAKYFAHLKSVYTA